MNIETKSFNFKMVVDLDFFYYHTFVINLHYIAFKFQIIQFLEEDDLKLYTD